MAWSPVRSSPVPKRTGSSWTPTLRHMARRGTVSRVFVCGSPAGRSAVVQLPEKLAPVGPSPAVVQFREKPTPAGLLSAVIQLQDKPTPAGTSSAVVRLSEELTLAGRSAQDSAELWLHEETEPANLPLLLQELAIVRMSVPVGIILTPIATTIPVLMTPLSSCLFNLLAVEVKPLSPYPTEQQSFWMWLYSTDLSWLPESSISDSSAAMSSESTGPTVRESSEETNGCILSSFFCLLFPFHCRWHSFRLHSMSDQFMQYWQFESLVHSRCPSLCLQGAHI